MGNFLSFITFQREKTVNPAVYLLKALAGLDVVLLVVFMASTLHLRALMTPGTCRSHASLITMIALRGSHYTLYTANIWLTCLIAGNLYVAVCRPYSFKLLCNLTNMRGVTILALLAALMYNAPRFVEYRIVPDTRHNETECYNTVGVDLVHDSQLYNIYFMFGFVTVGPAVVIIALYMCVICRLRRKRQNQCRARSPSNALLTNTTTATTPGPPAARTPTTTRTRVEYKAYERCLVLSVTVVCVVSSFTLVSAFVGKLLLITHWLNVCHPNKVSLVWVHHTIDCIMLLNSSCNFFVYCVIRKQFQKNLFKILRCKWQQ